MRRINKTELKQKLQKAISISQKVCDYLRSSESPQQIRVFNHAAGKIEAFSDVLQALNGNQIHLNISAGE